MQATNEIKLILKSKDEQLAQVLFKGDLKFINRLRTSLTNNLAFGDEIISCSN